MNELVKKILVSKKARSMKILSVALSGGVIFLPWQ